MFARIGDVLPRFQVYEKLFPDHERLLHALSLAYVDIIEFCSDAKAVFRRGQRASLASLKFGFKLMWKPFESQFDQKLENFRNHRKNVEKEAGLSHMVEAADGSEPVEYHAYLCRRVLKPQLMLAKSVSRTSVSRISRLKLHYGNQTYTSSLPVCSSPTA